MTTRQLKVYLNNGTSGRKLVEAEIVAERKTTYLVKLPDGNVIVRKKARDIIKENQ